MSQTTQTTDNKIVIQSQNPDQKLAQIEKQIETEVAKIPDPSKLLEISKSETNLDQTIKIQDDKKTGEISAINNQADTQSQPTSTQENFTPSMFITNKPIIGGIKPQKQKMNISINFKPKIKKTILIPILAGLTLISFSVGLYFVILNNPTTNSPQPVEPTPQIDQTPQTIQITGLTNLPQNLTADTFIKTIILAEEQFNDVPELKLDYLSKNISLTSIDGELQSIKITP